MANFALEERGCGCEGDGSPGFELDKGALKESGRVLLGDWTAPLIEQLSEGVAALAQATSIAPVQQGRVVAIRQTDTSRLFSSFKSGFYHSRYDDLQNRERFLKQLVRRHHTYEPIRGETVLFLFVGVSKSVYDGLSMFVSGRPTRIIGGSNHSVPWGVEVPKGVSDPAAFAAPFLEDMARIAQLFGEEKLSEADKEEMRVLRAKLPACTLMAPFILEFSEEALVTKVFVQRLWERGVEGRDTADVVRDMWMCCRSLDRGKFETLRDYHGSHTVIWEDGMRALRDSATTADRFIEWLEEEKEAAGGSAYEVVMRAFDRLGG